jgi:hypothetical protein
MKKFFESIRKYSFPFFASAIISTGWFFAGGVFGSFLAFGAAPEFLMLIYYFFYFGGYFVLILVLTRSFAKEKERPFWPLLFIMILPAIILWSYLFLTSYLYDQQEESQRKKDLEARNHAEFMLLQNTEFREITCELEPFANKLLLKCVLMTNFSYKINEATLDYTFTFRLKDYMSYKDERHLIVPNCILSNSFTDLRIVSENESPQHQEYQPGIQPVYLTWYFYGPNCRKENFRTLIGQELVIRDRSEISEIYDSITISNIEGL